MADDVQAAVERLRQRQRYHEIEGKLTGPERQPDVHLQTASDIAAVLAALAQAQQEIKRLRIRDAQFDAGAEALIEEIAQIRTAIGGDPESDLASLATTLRCRNETLEQENERLRAGGDAK